MVGHLTFDEKKKLPLDLLLAEVQLQDQITVMRDDPMTSRTPKRESFWFYTRFWETSHLHLPNLTFFLKWKVSINVGLDGGRDKGEEGIGCQFPESYIDSYISDLSPVFLREEPVLFDCRFKNIGFYDLTNTLLKQSCSCTLSFQQINYNNENIENQIRVLAAWNNYRG